MVLLVILLFVIGFFLIFFEALVPHGISVFPGIILVLLSGYLAIAEFGWAVGMIYCLMALAIALVLVRLTIRSGIRALRLQPPKRKPPASPAPGLNDEEAPAGPNIGDRAKVVQPLRPTGTIEWNGKRFPARTISPERESPAGTQVQIKGRDAAYLVVEEIVPD
ncbi:hypothetical protein HY256_01975 [Candidatus Sumerlaeota bacterium]|nr:hypothetical protein [Candidatus Sumerlaeota bacterium]